MNEDSAVDQTGTFHCPDCRRGFDGYHDCPEGEDRVGFQCDDCKEVLNRTVTDNIDIKGITPVRCGTCTLDRMARS